MPVVIAKTTIEATGQVSATQGTLPKTVIVTGLLDGAEAITVNVVDEDGNALPLYDAAGAAVTLNATSEPYKITTPIILQFVKPATTNAVGVQVNQ